MKINIKLLFLSVAMSVTAIPAFGWGQKGHDATVAIAERHLTPATRQALSEMFDGRSLVYWANWLDDASNTPDYAYSKTWHYKNIDEGVDYDSAPLLESGDIVRAISDQIGVARNPSSTLEQKRLAVKMLIHLLGDIHQPMHMGHASDRGANNVKVLFFDEPTNLHSVWDTSLPEAAHKWSYTEWADQIDRDATLPESKILYGTPSDWGKETFNVCTRVYNETPADSNLSYDYVSKWTPTIERQIRKGGLRLADILNTLFDDGYTTKTDAFKNIPRT